MEISHRIEKNICIVDIIGNLSVESVSLIKEYVKSIVDKKNIEKVLFNMKDITLLDSYGIGIIVGIFKTFQQNQVKFFLCNLSENNYEVFKMVYLDKILTVFESEEEAVSMIS